MNDINWSSIRVLVADDDDSALRLMEGLISKLGCQGTYVKNGMEAVDQCRGSLFDICFMDIMMPRMGGVEATQIIRDEGSKDMPVIAITSSNMQATRDKCTDVGMQDFIVKPVSLEIIKGAIEQYALKLS